MRIKCLGVLSCLMLHWCNNSSKMFLSAWNWSDIWVLLHQFGSWNTSSLGWPRTSLCCCCCCFLMFLCFRSGPLQRCDAIWNLQTESFILKNICNIYECMIQKVTELNLFLDEILRDSDQQRTWLQVILFFRKVSMLLFVPGWGKCFL